MGAVLEFTLHLIFVDFDPVFVALDRALVLGLHLSGLCLSELNLLLHQSGILFKVDVLVVQFVFSLVKLVLHLVKLLDDFDLVKFEFFLLFVDHLFFLLDKGPRRLNLVLKSYLFSF